MSSRKSKGHGSNGGDDNSRQPWEASQPIRHEAAEDVSYLRGKMPTERGARRIEARLLPVNQALHRRQSGASSSSSSAKRIVISSMARTRLSIQSRLARCALRRARGLLRCFGRLMRARPRDREHPQKLVSRLSALGISLARSRFGHLPSGGEDCSAACDETARSADLR